MQLERQKRGICLHQAVGQKTNFFWLRGAWLDSKRRILRPGGSLGRRDCASLDFHGAKST